MRRIVPALVDLAAGLVFVAIALFAARVLLQSRLLVYVCFPLLCTAALVIGFWRGGAGSRPVALIAVLATLPLFLLAFYFFSGRNRPFVAFPIVVFVFVAAGAALPRTRAKPLLVAIGIVAMNAAAAVAGPLFVGFLARGQTVTEKPIPFAIRLVDGRTISSQQLRGRIVVLDFWATWCVPCQQELPILQRVYDKTKGRSDVAFFAVDGVMTDTPGDAGDTAMGAVAYYDRAGYTIPLAWDGGAVLEKAFALHGFPTLLVIDKSGQVRMRHVGFIGSEDLERTLLDKIDALR
jgi:thiol-disulfide isomerase/thioredoxin